MHRRGEDWQEHCEARFIVFLLFLQRVYVELYNTIIPEMPINAQLIVQY
jgi:hypothetical protein